MTGHDPGAEPAPARYAASWLALREPADARARARDLAVAAAEDLGGPAPVVVHDLGCGTGSMARWLAPMLPGPQHWVLHDRDPDLLARAAASLPQCGADGCAVTAEIRVTDVARLTAADLSGARLVTASALLDVLTGEEVGAVAASCAGAGVPALLTLSVVGRVDLTPADPLDGAVATAFDAHQRRAVAGRRLLGPDAVEAAGRTFTALGGSVQVRPSPWRLGAGDAALVAGWLDGWAGAAAEQDPGLPVGDYLGRRRATLAAGRLDVTVQHADLLVRWRRHQGGPTRGVRI
jgi:hypothetical protein